MRCTKCGYVSFDYLAECKKCGVVLAGTREGLGFASAKPAIPFFLGGLLKDYVKPPAKDDKDLTEYDALPDLDFGEEIESNGNGNGNRTVAQAAAAQAEGAGREQTDIEEFNLLDLSDEELDLLIEDGGPEKAAGHQKAMDFDGALRREGPAVVADGNGSMKGAARAIPGVDAGLPPGPAAEQSAAKPEEPVNESLVVDLSENDLESLLSELEGSTRRAN